MWHCLPKFFVKWAVSKNAYIYTLHVKSAQIDFVPRDLSTGFQSHDSRWSQHWLGRGQSHWPGQPEKDQGGHSHSEPNTIFEQRQVLPSPPTYSTIHMIKGLYYTMYYDDTWQSSITDKSRGVWWKVNEPWVKKILPHSFTGVGRCIFEHWTEPG